MSTSAPASPSNPPTSPAPPDNKKLRNIIIGVVIAGVAFIVLLILLFICLRRTGRKERPEKFWRVLEEVDTNGGARSLRKNSTPGRTERGRHLELHPLSSTAPLQADFEGGQVKRSSFIGSVHSRARAGAPTLAAPSIFRESEAHFGEESAIPIPPPLPIPPTLTGPDLREFTETPPLTTAGQEQAPDLLEPEKPPAENDIQQPQSQTRSELPSLEYPLPQISAGDAPVNQAEFSAVRAELLAMRHRLAILEAAESPPDYVSSYSRGSG
ncbi:hypothetical protein PQX77_018297 [Marasmius sp. AFHP31]|nr:hypothetical protein PQX77_018297 [Marasmius sp. AFHP31]